MLIRDLYGNFRDYCMESRVSCDGVESRWRAYRYKGDYDFVYVVVSDDAFDSPGNGIFNVARVAKTRLTWCWISS